MLKSAPQVVIANPATVELAASPFPSSWVLDGHPEARATSIAKSQDGAMTVIAWSCTKGRFRWRYQVDEMVHILSGEVIVTDHTGAERRLMPGDTAFFPAGSTSVWEINEHVRKIAVCRVAVPRLFVLTLRAWNKLARIGAQVLGLDAEEAEAAGGLLEGEHAAHVHPVSALKSR
jgi:uncharacterized protein